MCVEQTLTARQWYEKGNSYSRKGDWQNAIECDMESIELDADSPAVEAKAMIEGILNFYNKDAYNP